MELAGLRHMSVGPAVVGVWIVKEVLVDEGVEVEEGGKMLKGSVEEEDILGCGVLGVGGDAREVKGGFDEVD